MKNLACGIEYDGTVYRGFQRQHASHGSTVQSCLEASIQQISQAFSVINGAGRTDAGVHASGQVISFRTPSQMPTDAWLRALNALLPNDISVRWVREVPERFHARFSARARSYRYTIWNEPAPSALHSRFSYHVKRPLAVEQMQAACQYLIGRKDFGAFGRSPDETNPLKPGPHHTVRTLQAASCFHQDQVRIVCDFRADAFLRGMVRRMVGTLVLVGLGRLRLDEFATLVERAEKTHPGSSAPACGLCLVRVDYPEEVWSLQK